MLEQLTLWSEEAPANPLALQGTENPYKENHDSCSSTFELFVRSVQDTCSGRMSQVACPRKDKRVRRGALSDNCSQSFATSVMAWQGEFWTRNSSEWPSDADVCFLSDVLEIHGVPQKYFLSPKACAGILRRAQNRGKPLPLVIECALWEVILLYLGKTMESLQESDLDQFEEKGERLNLPTHFRYDADVLGGGKGPLIQDDVSATLATSNHQTIFQPVFCLAYSIAGNIINRKANNGGNGNGFNEEVSYTLNTIDRHAVCFQQNQRDEVRLIGGVGDISGALSAGSGAKNQNYLCVADDDAKAAIDEDLCGTLKVGGGTPWVTYQRSQESCAPETTRESAPNTSKRAR